MSLSMSKKLLLIGFFMNSIMVGMEKLTQENCKAIPVMDSEMFANKTRYSVWFFTLQNQFLRRTNFFDRPVKSTSWDAEKPGFLHIQFEDKNTYEIDINKAESGKNRKK